MGYCHKNFSIRSLLLMVLLLGGTEVVLAQDVPILQPLFEPFIPDGEPGQCGPFACFNRSAFDGDTLASLGLSYPAIYVFVRQGSSWGFQATLTNSLSPNPEDPYPVPYTYPLALHGDEIFVTWVSASTEVHVFRRQQSPSGAHWVQQQIITLTSADGARSLLPIGISLDGDRAAISTGSTVQVFKRGPNHQYRIEARLSPDSDDAPFGSSIALQGGTVAVGAPTDNASAGAVYIFRRAIKKGKDSWVLAHKVESPLGDASIAFGTAVALDRHSLAVGAPLATDATTDAGNGYQGLVYVYSLAGLPHRQPRVVTDPYEPIDNGSSHGIRSFGATVDIQGRRLLVGISNPYPFAFEPGAYLFERDRHVWQPVAELASDRPLDVQLSRSTAMVESEGYRGGGFPGIYDLPAFESADATADEDAEVDTE